MNALRGPILNPRPGGTVDLHTDGLLCWDDRGVTYVGDYDGRPAEASRGIVMPPMLDCHLHVPQWPIRGHFCDGVGHCAGGRLLDGLNRNVFPTEAKCGDPGHAAAVVAKFRDDTLSKGVVGGAAYMTVHASATHTALADLGELWNVGLVLMNQNCPEYLRTDEAGLERDVGALASHFGRRLILTDRFAVAVDSPLRRRAVALAQKFGLRMQTHLNEQPAEKDFVERTLYPDTTSYTDVYRRDGLLDRGAILAHCIHMRPEEWDMVSAAGAVVAHCPTSNALLGSGIMALDTVIDRRVPYAICTDVGASPTTSLLAEMAVFLRVHRGRSQRATGSEALCRTTLGAAELLGVADRVGTLAVSRPASFIEVAAFGEVAPFGPVEASADATITHALLGMSNSPDGLERALDQLFAGGVEDGPTLSLLERFVRQTADRLDNRVRRVMVDGRTTWAQS